MKNPYSERKWQCRLTDGLHLDAPPRIKELKAYFVMTARHGVAPGRGAVRDREVREEEDIAGAHRRHAHLGFGRIVASEIELSILLGDPV